MKPLVVLLSVFCLSLVLIRLFTGNWSVSWPGNIAMSAMLIFTAIGHFAFTGGMEAMLPSFIPFKRFLVLFTGYIEIAAALGLLIPAMRGLTAWLLILFFLLVLPANVYAALNKMDYQKGTATGPGPVYLWFRIPLQVLFIAWVYLSNFVF